MSPITRLTAAAVGGVLLLATACGGGREGPAPQPPPTSSPAEEKEKDSIFDSAVRVAVKYDQPGFNFQDQETRAYAGFEKDLAEYLSSELKFTMDLKDEPSHRREKVLENGTSQLVIATYSITEDREEQVDFAGPYFQTRQGLLVRAGNKDITSRETTAGKVICTVSGSTSAPETSGAGKKLAQLLPKARVDLRDSYSQCVDQLRRGNFDAVWTDRAVLYGFMERYDDIKVVEKLELGSPQRYGVGVQEGREGDCRKIADALRRFLGTDQDWRNAFRSHFPRLAKEDPDFEQHYKPAPETVDDYSCSDD
ncbi:transporter substrate-binding domain-containing protein [Streptomyces xinghaiensis]|uniref:transporter substrate-binding domain-containing protein n=1 Tax=Streptomyces xinghaiensis TaxID=1038928 RepID=UPI002E0E3170|nr:transporter substrate-binding domain-containing protein [Streptomyces xinghaiensis]